MAKEITQRQIAEMDQAIKTYNEHAIPQWRAMYLKCVEEGFTPDQALSLVENYVSSVIYSTH